MYNGDPGCKRPNPTQGLVKSDHPSMCLFISGKIKADDLGYLRELLDAIERQDLCEMIKVYEEGG